MPKFLFNFDWTVSSSTARRRHHPPELNNRNRNEKDEGNSQPYVLFKTKLLNLYLDGRFFFSFFSFSGWYLWCSLFSKKKKKILVSIHFFINKLAPIHLFTLLLNTWVQFLESWLYYANSFSSWVNEYVLMCRENLRNNIGLGRTLTILTIVGLFQSIMKWKNTL